MLNTPVLFLVFNRPDVTGLVFDAIRKAKPRQLFIAADGPRAHKEGEKEKCEEVRNLLMKGIDWDCEVKTLFREQNLGCKYAVSGAITWFFEHVEEGIILEDDCLPDPTFFSYCSEMLERYRNEPSVMHVSSNYFNKGSRDKKDSYYFSHYIEIWGWATWRRAWKLYDPEMKAFPALDKSKFLKDTFQTEPERMYWMNCFTGSFKNRVDTWDYQWVFCVYHHSGLGITPYVNLVANLGFRSDATHTTVYHEAFSNMKAGAMPQIIHPERIELSLKDDLETFRNIYEIKDPGIKRKWLNRLRRYNRVYSVLKRVYNKLLPPPKKYGWFGNYRTWQEAEKLCTGYNSANILEKVKGAVLKVKKGEAVYERDSVVFDKVEYSEPMLEAFNTIIRGHKGKLHVVDFGGSLGSSYFQLRNLLSGLTELKWSVVEQGHFVDCGKTEIADEQLQFYYKVEDALKHQEAQVLLLSSVLQYFSEPYKLISQLLSHGFEYIIIDRTAFIDSPKERITRQVVPEEIYQASYPAWFLNKGKFISAFAPEYELITEFDCKFDPVEKLDGTLTYRKGFVFKKSRKP